LDTFFEPGKEILLPTSSEDVVNFLQHLSDDDVRRIGDAAQARVLAEHTSEIRAREFETAVELAASSPNQRDEATVG
jgi:spore maturation protein CgeB